MLMWDLRQDSLSRPVVDKEVAAIGRELDVKFDEVALLARNEEHALDAVHALKRQGWEHFNEAADLVHTEPFGVSYGVSYWFLRHPETSWRLELMCSGSSPYGFSPLHEALRAQAEEDRRGGDPFWVPLVHLSYKSVDEEQYEQEVERLGTHGYVHGQSCRSTYGRFSYLRKGITGVYVKPRVNLRDHGIEAAQ